MYFLQPPIVQACFQGDAVELRSLITRKEDVNSLVKRTDLNFNYILCNW